MANLIRRGGGKIVKLLESSADPTPVAGEATIYAKDSSGTTKLYMQDGAGTVQEVGTGGGGGYQGAWSTGTYQSGSIVRRGPFTFGAVNTTAIDPCDTANVGDPAHWTLSHNGGGAQSGNIAQLTNNTTGKAALLTRNTTIATWDKKRFICDALVGPNGGADYLFLGVYDSSLSQAIATPIAAGTYGVTIDFWNNRFTTLVDGVQANIVTYSTAAQLSGNDLIETSRFHRYYLDMEESGANCILTLYRNAFDLTTAAGIDNPGFLNQWTIAKPTFTTSRSAAGAQVGGVAGLLKVRSLFTLDQNGDWDMLAMFPHAPRIDHGIF
jgi:hypothetical protein